MLFAEERIEIMEDEHRASVHILLDRIYAEVADGGREHTHFCGGFLTEFQAEVFCQMLCRQVFPCPASAYKEEVLGIFNSFNTDVLAELVLPSIRESSFFISFLLAFRLLLKNQVLMLWTRLKEYISLESGKGRMGNRGFQKHSCHHSTAQPLRGK